MKQNNYYPEDHIDRTDFYIGTIIFPDTLLQEYEISGKYRLNEKSIGECKIEVYAMKEGNIPHFHLFTPDHSFETCICIYSPNFFSHGGKYRDVLNSRQCKMLDEYLRQPSKQNPIDAVWKLIQSTWEVGNQNCKFPQERKIYLQPDYSRMTQFKDN